MDAHLENRTTPLRSLVPSLSQWLWVAVFGMLLVAPWRLRLVGSDGDTLLHWRVGEWMLEQRAVIRHDVFSHTRAQQPVIAMEWLSEVAYAAVERQRGLYGAAVLAAALIATTFALLHRQLLREGSDALTATLLVLLAVGAAKIHWLARPHVFSYLLLFFWQATLRRWSRGGGTGRLWLSLAGLMVLWVNFHGGFLAGFLVLAAYWLGAVCERDARNVQTLTVAGLVCAAASLLNPNGWRVHLHNLEFLRSEYLTGWLGEFASPNFHSPEIAGFVIWLAVMFVLFAALRPKLAATEVWLLLSWVWFALYSCRNISLLAILSTPILAPAASEWLRTRWPAAVARVERCTWPGRAGLLVAAALAVALVAPLRVELPAKDWPVEAVRFVREHPDRFSGNVFNDYVWGGYLMHALPEQKVFVDGRADFYGENLIREFTAINKLATNWVELLQHYDVQWTLLPREQRLNRALPLVPGWACAYSDETAVVMCRKP